VSEPATIELFWIGRWNFGESQAKDTRRLRRQPWIDSTPRSIRECDSCAKLWLTRVSCFIRFQGSPWMAFDTSGEPMTPKLRFFSVQKRRYFAEILASATLGPSCEGVWLVRSVHAALVRRLLLGYRVDSSQNKRQNCGRRVRGQTEKANLRKPSQRGKGSRDASILPKFWPSLP
jgi:hypothetical protein